MIQRTLITIAFLSVVMLNAQEKTPVNQSNQVAKPVQLGATTTQNEGDDTLAEFVSGNIFVEGNLTYMSSTDNSVVGVEKTTSVFGFNPKVGYFLDSKLAVGVELGYNSNKTSTITGGSVINVNSNFGGGIFARYYFLNLGKRFKTYGDLGFGLGGNKKETSTTVGITNTTTSTKASTIGAGLDLGINYFVKENIAISFGLSDVLSVTRTQTKGADGPITDFNLNINNLNNFFNGAQFGLMFLF